VERWLDLHPSSGMRQDRRVLAGMGTLRAWHLNCSHSSGTFASELVAAAAGEGADDGAAAVEHCPQPVHCTAAEGDTT